MRRSRWLMGVLAVGGMLAAGLGCGRKSSLLLERQARGPIQAEPSIARPVQWTLTPTPQTQAEAGIEVTVNHGSSEFLARFFSNRQVFGDNAGLNPYFPEQLVFYVRIANRSGKKLRLDPAEFVLLDDLGNQYQVLHADYTTALAEAKAPVGRATHGVLEEARPGYFGLGFPLGKLFPKSQRRFGLLSMASLQAGYLYSGAAYDGLIAFWNPHREAKRLRLLLANLKTDFNAHDWPETSLDLTFEFDATS